MSPVYYVQISKRILWELLTEDEEWYTDSVSRWVLHFQNTENPEEYYTTYGDTLDHHDFVQVTEMEALAWLST